MGFNWLFGRRENVLSNSDVASVNSPHTSFKDNPLQRVKSLSKGELLASTLLALEPRIVFDGAMAATAGDMADQVAADQAASVDVFASQSQELQTSDELIAALTADEPTANEIVFIDGNLPDIEVLLSGIDPNIEVVILNSDTDGVEQIASHLEGRSGIDGIHIIAHGRPGTLDLGTAKLTEASINGKHADEIATIRAALSENADFLIYGCNFADQARGASAVAALALATGADVAASTDLTGAEDLDGNWDLEVHTGAIETDTIEAENWDGVLLVNSASGASTDPADFEFVNTGDNANISLSDGQSLLIQSGTFTGNINSLPADATIVVAEGATFNPGNINNWSGELIVLGEATLSNTNLGDGASIQNEGSFTFVNSPNGNIDISFTNHTAGELTFENTFSINGAGFDYINNGTINVDGNFEANNGSIVNNGVLDVAQQITLNSNSSLTNNSVIVADSGLTNNGSDFENNGNIVLTGTSSSFTNNGNGVLTSGPNARVSGVNFTNDGTVTGGGEFVFSGTTINRSSFDGSGEGINFFDSSPTGTQTFDTEQVVPTNTTNNTATPVQPTDPVIVTGAPRIDLDVLGGVGEANDPTPSLIDLNITEPTIINDGGVEDLDGAGEQAVYSSVAVVDGVTIDLVATLVSLRVVDEDGNASDDPSNPFDPNPESVDGEDGGTSFIFGTTPGPVINGVPTFDARQSVPGELGEAVVRYELIDQDSGNPVPLDFSFLFGDLDQFDPSGRDVVRVSTNAIDGFIIEEELIDATSGSMVRPNLIVEASVIEGENFLSFSGTDNDLTNAFTDSDNAVQLVFSNTATFEATLIRDFGGRNIGFAGTIENFFDNPDLTDTNNGFENVFVEGQDPVNVVSGTGEVDDASEDDINLLTITPGNIVDGTSEVITFNGDGNTSVSLALDGSDTNSQSLTVSGTVFAIRFNAVSGAIEITEENDFDITQGSLNALIRGITYENTSVAPTEGLGTDRTFTFQATDSSGLASNEAVSTIQVIAVNNAPTIDLDLATDNAPIPGEGGFANLNLNTLLPENIGNDGNTEEEDGEGNGEFARFTNTGSIDGQDIDVVLTVVRLITDPTEFAGAAPLQDDSINTNVDNPIIEVNNGSAQVTVGNNFTGSDNDITFELRVEIVAAGTDTPVSGNIAILVNDLDFNNVNSVEEVGVFTNQLDSFAIGNGGNDDDETTITSSVSDIIVFDAQQNQIFVGSDNPDDFPSTDLIRFRSIDVNANAQANSPANSLQLNFTNTDEFSLIINRRNTGGGFGLNSSFNSGFFAQSVVVDTNPDFGNIFTEGEAPVAIASSNINISDDLESIDSATIVLTNPQPDDLISVTGILPTGIVATINSDSSITLTGNATPDAYEQAILAITFENTSSEPDDVTVRQIEISVTDDASQTSNTALSSIQVINVPPDTDSDGVTDDIDIDNDNDGILDVDEQVITLGSNLIADGGFVDGTNAAAVAAGFTFGAFAGVSASGNLGLTGGLFEEIGAIDGSGAISIATNGTAPAVTVDLGQLDSAVHRFAFDVENNSGSPAADLLLVTIHNTTTDMQHAVLFNATLNGFAR